MLVSAFQRTRLSDAQWTRSRAPSGAAIGTAAESCVSLGTVDMHGGRRRNQYGHVSRQVGYPTASKRKKTMEAYSNEQSAGVVEGEMSELQRKSMMTR